MKSYKDQNRIYNEYKDLSIKKICHLIFVTRMEEKIYFDILFILKYFSALKYRDVTFCFNKCCFEFIILNLIHEITNLFGEKRSGKFF